MDNMTKEVAIDTGGGWGEHFANMARTNPDKSYLVLDINFPPIKRKPSNLYMIRWMSDVDSALPFREDSIDRANISFLMGEIKSKGDKNLIEETLEVSCLKYRRMLTDLHRSLKKGGLLEIVDAKGYIGVIQKMLEEEHYTVVHKPKKLEDVTRTKWTKFFSNAFQESGSSENDTFVLPMIIVARK